MWAACHKENSSFFHYVLCLFPHIIMFLQCNVILVTEVTKDQHKAFFYVLSVMRLRYCTMNQACSVLKTACLNV